MDATIDEKLYGSVKSGDIHSLKQLLLITGASKPDEVNVDNHLLRQTHFNNNSLHVAVQLSESVTLVEEIFNQCGPSKSLAMLMQQNMNGNTPLHIAARFGSTEIVSMFIDLARKCHSNDYHDQRKDEDYIDVERGITSTESLPDAEKGATLNNMEQLVRIANKNNNTALHEALRYKADSGIPLLLRRADPGFEYFANDYGETPLYLAVQSADFDLVEHIFNICPTQSYGAPGGRTALHALALLHCHSGSAYKLVYLLRHLLKEVDQNGRTALHYAAYSDYTEFVDGVMNVDPSLCYLPDKDGRTALHHAAAKGGRRRIQAMKIMLEHSMDCWEVLDNEGKNFLHVAADNSRCSVLRYVLRDISSDWVVETIISTRDKNGKTPCEMTEEFSSILSSSTRVERNNWNRDGFLLFDNAHNGQTAAKRAAKKENIKKAAQDRDDEYAIEAAETEVAKNTAREKIENYNQNLVLVAALIATLAFAANFTLPGGYNSDGPHKGMAVLANKPSFIVFIVSNSLAMVLSALVIFIYFWGKLLFLVSPDTDMIKNRKLLVMGVFCNLFAIPAMMMSFVTGTYTVLSHFPGLAIPVCILGCIYFVLSYLVIAKILQWWENDPEIAR